jgi:hypothetical protein
LNGQEIRHALHKGPVRSFLKELSETPAFLKATDRTVNKERMADRECALRFLAFQIDPWERYTSNDLDGFLGNAMKQLNGMSVERRQQLKADFEKAMKGAFEIFGRDAFRKRYAKGAGRNPVSKALFEAWSVELARRTPQEIATLVERKERVRDGFVELMKNDRAFDVAISYSTGVPQRVTKRFQGIQNLVQECLE